MQSSWSRITRPLHLQISESALLFLGRIRSWYSKLARLKVVLSSGSQRVQIREDMLEKGAYDSIIRSSSGILSKSQVLSDGSNATASRTSSILIGR